MFTIPDTHVTKIGAGEILYIAKVGNGVASLCGKKAVIKVPSEGLRLGERFRATASNKLVRFPDSPVGAKPTRLRVPGRKTK